jgi:lipopolysaccharide biosynthesis glycosyltransferase
VASKHGQQLEFVSVEPRLFQAARVSGHVSVATYFRILIPEILPPDVARVLFLDSDIVVRGTITELYEQPLDRYTHAAVANPVCGVFKAHPPSLGIPAGTPYFNAGVLLFNLDVWRSEHIGDRVMDYINTHGARLRFWDQDALNATLHSRWLKCHPTWNAVAAFFEGIPAAELEVSQADLTAVAANPRIVHFTGSWKPWNYYCQHPFKREYFKYLAHTPWRGYRPADQPAAAVRARLMLSRLAPGVVKQAYRTLTGRTQAQLLE